MDTTPADSRICPHCSAACSSSHQYCPSCGFPIGTMGSTTDDKFVGRTLPGGHHILDLISVGGMGRVYRAEQSVLGRTVAVKIIHPHLLADENSAVRFLTEARAASQLNHPNSVSVFDFGRTDDGQPYLVMEFLRGKDLARVTYEEGPLPFTRIVDVLRQVLGALGEAHDLGIVHRDLKPENVILEPLRRGGDFVKVVDFGLAKLKADTQSTSITNPGIVCGTPDYMAPEQGRGDEIDGRSDLYAVGVILFQLLTGRLPFEADSPTQVVMMHLSIPVPDPRQVAPERQIPDPLVEVVMTALAKDAKDRYQDAHEYGEALKRALTISQSVPPPPSVAALSTQIVECPSCGQNVPLAKFCGECAAPLPRRSFPGEYSVELPLPLVGRDDDLAWLEDRRATLGNFAGARLVGDPGIGKTRLIEEFVGRLRARGDFVVTTGPDPYWAQVAYHGLRRAIRGLARLGDADIDESRFEGANPDARRGLTEIFRGMPSREDQRAALERRHGLAEALAWALRQAALYAEPNAVVLVIDDLDRVDTPSRWAIADALSESQNFPVLFLAAHAPGFEAGWGSEHAAGRVLGELPPPTAARLLPGHRWDQQLGDIDQIRGVSPLYVEQIVRYSMEGGSDPPARLADLIAFRVDSLDTSARRALQALVVLGDRTERSTIAELLPKEQELELTIRGLVTAGMIKESDDGRLSASHPLLREIVLAGIPVAVRRELHARALRLGEKSAAPIEASALHALFAQDSLQALLLLEQVADRASSRGDSYTEVLALRRGLEIARQEIARGELDDPLRAVLIFSRKLGASLTRAGDFADAEGVLREALDIAGPSGADRAKVLSALAHVAYGRQRGSEALGYIDQAIVAAENSNEHELVSSLTDTRRAWAS